MKPYEAIALGFDIGGTKTKIGLVNQSGRIIAYKEFPTDIRGDSLNPFLGNLIRELHEVLNLADRNVIGIGITFLGWIDETRTGPFLCMNAPALHGFNLKNFIESEFHLPVVLNDDVTAHTLAEYTFGSGQGVRRFMCLAMGTGLSAGVIINGEPLRFTGGCSGDTGHLILRPDAEVFCTGGCKGCAEALIGTRGIDRLAVEKYGSSRPVFEIIQAARHGDDPLAVAIIQQIGGYTGELLASLSHIFLPEVICLTGGTSNAGSVLLEAVKRRFNELVGEYHRNYSQLSGGYYNGVEIVLSKLPGETGVIGSVVDLFNPSIFRE